MHADGSCHCGAIRFTAEVDPRRVGICHCTDCQTFSGGAFRVSAIVPEQDLELLEGEPAIYEKTAESGRPRKLAFCDRCGTHLFGMNDDGERLSYTVRIASLAQRRELPPVAQVWCRSALPWLDGLSALPRIETQ